VYRVLEAFSLNATLIFTLIIMMIFWQCCRHRRNNRRDRGRLGDQQCIGPQLLSRSFQKARNYTAFARIYTS